MRDLPSSSPPPATARSIQAVIFDCDGVLVDSEYFSCSAWLPVLARRGIAATLNDIQSFIGRSDRAVLQHFETQSGSPLAPGAIEEREVEYFALAEGKLRAFNGVRGALSALHSLGIRLAVASSGGPRKIEFNLSQAGLLELLPLRCSSTQVPRGKPHPDLFLFACEQVGCEPGHTVVVEDSVPGILAARAAGMRVVGYPSSHPAAELIEAGASAICSDYSNLLRELALLGSL